ncbi:hypothetical protein Tco_0569144 [Tanacetum coccineum]
MIYCLSIVETDKVIHTVETDIVKLMVEIESFGMSSDEFDKETGSSDGLQPKQADLSCVHALNELHLHEIHVVPSKHEVDQCGRLSTPERIALSARVVIEKFKSPFALSHEISSVGVIDEVFLALGWHLEDNTCDLGSFGEETDKLRTYTKSLKNRTHECRRQGVGKHRVTPSRSFCIDRSTRGAKGIPPIFWLVKAGMASLELDTIKEKINTKAENVKELDGRLVGMRYDNNPASIVKKPIANILGMEFIDSLVESQGKDIKHHVDVIETGMLWRFD